MTSDKRLYHSLLTREYENSPWSVQFGDYSKAVVRQELLDTYTRDCDGKRILRKNTKIITTTYDQAAVQAAVDDLNAN